MPGLLPCRFGFHHGDEEVDGVIVFLAGAFCTVEEDEQRIVGENSEEAKVRRHHVDGRFFFVRIVHAFGRQGASSVLSLSTWGGSE